MLVVAVDCNSAYFSDCQIDMREFATFSSKGVQFLSTICLRLLRFSHRAVEMGGHTTVQKGASLYCSLFLQQYTVLGQSGDEYAETHIAVNKIDDIRERLSS